MKESVPEETMVGEIAASQRGCTKL